MDSEKLVGLVTAEVLRQLKQSADFMPGPLAGPGHRALVIFTGGTIGLEPGLDELRKLQAAQTELTIVLSAAAETIIGSNWVKEKLGSDVKDITAQAAYPGDVLRAADVVLVPVLTQNTAAKLARTFADTMVSTLILQALMLGKPVIAAANAADPLDGWRVKKNMDKAVPAFKEALQGNLKQLKVYGIQLVAVEDLAATTKKTVSRQEALLPPGQEKTAKRQVLDAGMIRQAAQTGAKNIKVPPGTIITPLARDVAGECVVEIVYS